jgi:RNA polymerase sigma factor (sigma-70 family)
MSVSDPAVRAMPIDGGSQSVGLPHVVTLPDFREVYHRYVTFVWSCARRMGVRENEIDDVVQEVFIVIHGKLATLIQPDSLRSWIYGIIRRTVSTYHRSKRTKVASARESIVSDLSPDLQRLVVAGRLASRPTDADRERVFSALQARLGIVTGIAGGAIGVSVSQSGSHALVAKIFGIAVATLAIATGGFVAWHSLMGSPAADRINPANVPIANAAHWTRTTQEPTPPQTASPSPLETTPAPVEPKTSSALGAARGSGRVHDSLSEEVAILSRAQTELHGGRAENALRLLAEHERKFRRGILAEERTSAKIQALCALGRVSEANALLGTMSPQSLTGESARQACSSSKKITPGR